jgi:hypothetical protein
MSNYGLSYRLSTCNPENHVLKCVAMSIFMISFKKKNFVVFRNFFLFARNIIPYWYSYSTNKNSLVLLVKDASTLISTRSTYFFKFHPTRKLNVPGDVWACLVEILVCFQVQRYKADHTFSHIVLNLHMIQNHQQCWWLQIVLKYHFLTSKFRQNNIQL